MCVYVCVSVCCVCLCLLQHPMHQHISTLQDLEAILLRPPEEYEEHFGLPIWCVRVHALFLCTLCE